MEKNVEMLEFSDKTDNDTNYMTIYTSESVESTLDHDDVDDRSFSSSELGWAVGSVGLVSFFVSSAL